jgi:sugar/nucleoside kinase (ribokinase family)
MPYARVREALREEATTSVVCLPDGSVDQHAAVFDGRGERVATRAAFGERIAAGALRSARLEARGTHPGGQSVNAARQANALGAEVAMFGHLDHPVLDLPFETHSMGDPTEVTVLQFEAAVVMLSRESGDIADWSFADLPDTFTDRVAGAGALCLANWVGVPGLTEAIEELTGLGPSCPVVFDPGDLSGSETDAVADLRRALGTLDERCPVVLSANGAELAALSGALEVATDGSPARERRLREALDIAGVVRHDEAEAVAATDDRLEGGTARVANFDAAAVRRRTGAGDRFSGALATALAAGLDVPAALALANTAATYFVSHAAAGDRESLGAFLDRRSFPDG